MNQLERYYKIVQLLSSQRAVPIRRMMEELEVSRPTIARDIRDLRDRFRAPIVWNADLGGYQFEPTPDGERFRDSVPGLWLAPDEVYALLTLINIVSSFDPGALENYLWPLKATLKNLLVKRRFTLKGLDKKFQVELPAPFGVWKILRTISAALVEEQEVAVRFSKSSPDRDGRYRLEKLVLTSNGWVLEARRTESADVVRFPVADIVNVIPRVPPQQEEDLLDLAAPMNEA